MTNSSRWLSVIAGVLAAAVVAAPAMADTGKLTRTEAAKLSTDPNVKPLKAVAKAAQAAPASCTFTNGTATAIPDNGAVESSIVVSGCTGNASAASIVDVNLTHTYKGDLVVTLIAPDGSQYVLHNRAGGSADNLVQAFTVNLGSEAANGTWRLRVQDAAQADTGVLNAWKLNLGGSTPTGCTGSNLTDLHVPDLATVESPIAIAGCTGTASASSVVNVDIRHTYKGDLVVTLIAPDGSTYVLHNRQGGSGDNITQAFSVNLSTEQRNGTWRLRVFDAATADTGYINAWTLTV